MVIYEFIGWVVLAFLSAWLIYTAYRYALTDDYWED